MGGWPKKLQHIVLGKRKPLRGRPGASLKPLNFKKVEAELAAKLKHEPTTDDVFSHLMYPEVFAEFAKFTRDFSDLSVLPTPAFFLRDARRPGNFRRDRGRQNAFHPVGQR